jgi:hypothetical protein
VPDSERDDKSDINEDPLEDITLKYSTELLNFIEEDKDDIMAVI